MAIKRVISWNLHAQKIPFLTSNLLKPLDFISYKSIKCKKVTEMSSILFQKVENVLIDPNFLRCLSKIRPYLHMKIPPRITQIVITLDITPFTPQLLFSDVSRPLFEKFANFAISAWLEIYESFIRPLKILKSMWFYFSLTSFGFLIELFLLWFGTYFFLKNWNKWTSQTII